MGESLIGLGVIAIYGALLSKVLRTDPPVPSPPPPPAGPPRAATPRTEDPPSPEQVIPANADLAETLRRNANGEDADVIDAEDL